MVLGNMPIFFPPGYHTEPAILAKFKGGELVETHTKPECNKIHRTGQEFTTLSIIAVYCVTFFLQQNLFVSFHHANKNVLVLYSSLREFLNSLILVARFGSIFPLPIPYFGSFLAFHCTINRINQFSATTKIKRHRQHSLWT